MTAPGDFQLIRSDYRTAVIPRGIRAVYADPPYYGNEDNYRCERVELDELIPRMEQIAPIRALSMSQGMLPEALAIRPEARICIWRKSFAFPVRRPYLSWEPVLLWGNLLRRGHDDATYVLDSITLHPAKDDRLPFWAPKPNRFCDWVLEMMIGSQTGVTVVDIFSGSGSMSRRAMVRGCSAIGIDTLQAPGGWTGDWRRPTLDFPEYGDQDQDEICPSAAAGYPAWPVWWDNRHQWVKVYRWSRPPGSTGTDRRSIDGVSACSECHQIRVPAGQRVPDLDDANQDLRIRRRSDGVRSWIPINASNSP